MVNLMRHLLFKKKSRKGIFWTVSVQKIGTHVFLILLIYEISYCPHRRLQQCQERKPFPGAKK